ncbi:DUF1836 domain-containing protein [Cytobacillus dafuensis]|uniref:DUF1836 domain-containing protein n=1 Tax=Cytobacillus dafuensis TaxID=1742359 RepID=A0A5B8Z4E6_CYTDA|nr:DUF1836 domain-containing protein [Cytobacillus dafuensis]QED47970.1 DUF1836 domain-containing protein [Cytobacillus dafuensis]
MENLQKIINSLNLENQIRIEDIPQIDLYMDQVIQLFENKFSGSKRNDEDKVLTKTMINNYAKGKLFFPINNKKYSKEHLILISLIYQLKGALSINDIKETLSGINERVMNRDINIDQYYETFLHLTSKNNDAFKEDIEIKLKEVKEEVMELEDSHSAELENILMIASLAHMSNLYRRAAEKLVDEMGDNGVENK